ncbi:MAG: ABC transporter ATP-binding protein [Humidesulfovibrio sp.]|nr:ABC transporter ATP-binding protein [Humidesulfovibrio sp.]
MNNQTAIMRVEALTKTYPTAAGEVAVLHGVDLELRAGEMVAIMGPSGCGKSSLLHILGLLAPPTSGRYAIMGQDMFGLSEDRQAAFRREYLGFILQSCNLFENSNVYENLEYPLIYARVPTAKRRAIIERALERVGLTSRIDYPANRLSGGEQQRVAIARALVNNPKVLLGDEPTGQLDRNTGGMVMEYFKHIVRERSTAMLIVTHDREVARQCTRGYTLKDGHLEPLLKH